ncbi:MAG: hypothetical protein SFU53_10030 [Terrimicrobiaceae bacterium]|nr:hypothetical protein [Terrimicrobiaceae bacterium]
MAVWKYVSNQFAVATENNFKKMFSLSADHDSRLDARKAEPGIAPLYVRFHPIAEAYSAAYIAWDAAGGTGEGETASVQSQLNLLSSTKVRQWDVQTQGVFDAKSPTYKSIWPDGRGPLQDGTIEQRIAAVKSLHDRMLPHAATLPAVLLADVLGFHTGIVALRNEQQGQQGAVAALSTALESARQSTATMMYGNLGVLMDLYRENPAAIEDFWDLSLIRETGGSDEEEPTPTLPAV